MKSRMKRHSVFTRAIYFSPLKHFSDPKRTTQPEKIRLSAVFFLQPNVCLYLLAFTCNNYILLARLKRQDRQTRNSIPIRKQENQGSSDGHTKTPLHPYERKSHEICER